MSWCCVCEFVCLCVRVSVLCALFVSYCDMLYDRVVVRYVLVCALVWNALFVYVFACFVCGLLCDAVFFVFCFCVFCVCVDNVLCVLALTNLSGGMHQ